MNPTGQLAVELSAFKQQLPWLLAEHGVGKFALFIEGAFKGAFQERVDAIRSGYSQSQPGHFLVRKITDKEEVVHMASPLFVG